MAVTITPTANTALNTDLIFSGNLAISGALADNSETLNVSLYYTKDGATFYGVPQVYNGTSTVIYNYPNGTVFTLDFSTGAWTYQRLVSEVGSTDYQYTLTFTFKGATTVSNTLSITPVQNITVNSLTVADLDDLDNTITGVADLSFVDVTGLKIKIDVDVDGTTLTASEQSMTSATATHTFNYSDGSKMVINLGDKTWTYTRKATDVGDNVSNVYDINIVVGNLKLYLHSASYVGSAPLISKFSANTALDTDTKITGVLNGEYIVGEVAKIDVKHNNVIMSGTNQTLTPNSLITWTYSDTSTFILNTSTWEWEYNRLQSDYEDLRVDDYNFDITITSRYGTDNVSLDVETPIPSATILGFSAEGVTDTEPTIEGVLKYVLPTVATAPSMQVDVTVNGTQYIGTPINLETATKIDFTYSDTSKFEVDPDNGTFTFTRSRDDVDINSNDTYSFRCSIIVNGQRAEQTISVKTYSTVRNYDYQPAYPVQFYAGSPEAENTAWAKYIEEIKRIYRLYNENMNYYDSLNKNISKRIDELEARIGKGIAAETVGIILPYVGDLEDIPNGWYLCDGTNGTPDMRDRFITCAGGQYTIGATGGENAHKMTIAEMPSHSHRTGECIYVGGNMPHYSSNWGLAGNGYGIATGSEYVGGNQAMENRPPFYAVYYIMKVAES